MIRRALSATCFKQSVALSAILFLAVLAGKTSAAVRMPGIFGDHMVLQRDTATRVWGWADPSESVSVTFAGRTEKTIADASGSWQVKLKDLQANATSSVLTIQGTNRIVYQDVVVGDIWLASGQSNMEFGIQTEEHGQDAIAQANDPSLRMFVVPWATALEPQKDIAASPPHLLNARWVVCTPESMRANWGWHGFSAVGYHFAADLRKFTQQPVGMIASYKGGTPAQAWTSMAALESVPAMVGYVEGHQKILAGYDDATRSYKDKQSAFRVALDKWDHEVGTPYNEALAAWRKSYGADFVAGKTVPPAPRLSRPRPQEPTPPDGGFSAPANLYNAMVAPLTPMSIKGVIWYQGESNAGVLSDATMYQELFGAMIQDWRKNWQQENMPFIYVQLASFKASREPRNGNWPWLREAQFKTLSLPGTAMASAVDVGDPNNIHPADKRDIGLRLSLAARKLAYGDNVVASGPVYKSMQAEGKQIRINFEQTAGGLEIASAPWTPQGAKPADTSKLCGFIIAGADRKFVEATAVISGSSVLVSSSAVVDPVAVRYNWSDTPEGNLYSKVRLPALPFRTDGWEPGPLDNLATEPISGNAGWVARFNANVEQAKGRKIDLIFDGDSITDWFQNKGKDVWTKYYGNRRAVDFGIAGDQTSQVLWRIEHGQLDGLDPKLVVLLIGTNNTIRDSSEQIAEGVKACVDGYLARCPHAHILLLGIFPRRSLYDPIRAKCAAVNTLLEKMPLGSRVTYTNFGDIFLDTHQEINTQLLGDKLHPTPAGYEAWASTIEPIVSRYLPSN